MSPPSRLLSSTAVPEAQGKSLIFEAWRRAEQQVPFPFLYSLEATPRKGQAAGSLADLSTIQFAFRITAEFTAQVTLANGAFGTGELRRENLAFRLMPMQGSTGLLTPEAALQHLVRELPRLAPEKDEQAPGVKSSRRGAKPEASIPAWASLALLQNFQAGIIEPHYFFREYDSTRQFVVGARTGRVRVEQRRD